MKAKTKENSKQVKMKVVSTTCERGLDGMKSSMKTTAKS